MIDTKILYPPIIDETYSCTNSIVPIEFLHTVNVDTSRIIVKLQTWNKDENKWETNIALQNVSNNSITLQDGKIRIQAMTIAKGQVILNLQQWLEDSNNKQYHSAWSDTIEKIVIDGSELNIRINNALAIEVSTTENISNNFAYLKASLYSQLEKRYLIKPDSVFYTNVIKPSDTFVIPNQVHTVNYEVEYVTKEGFSLIDSGIVDIVVNEEIESTNLNIRQSNSSLEISNPFVLSDALEVDIIRENLNNQTFERVKVASPSLETYEEKTPCIGEEYEYYLGCAKEIKNNSMDFIKNIPNNAMPYAEISKVGGMTHYLADVQILFNSRVTEIKSIGTNHIPYPYKESTITKNGITFTVNSDGSVTINGTANDTVYFTLGDSIYLQSGTYCISTNIQNVEICVIADGEYYWNTNFTLDDSANVEVFIRILKGNSFNNIIVKPMLNKGMVSLPYSPYMEHTLPIAAETQALEGYGWGVNETCYNYIDFENKMFVKRVGCVSMGELNWNKWSAYDNGFYAQSIPNLKSGTNNLLTTRYTAGYSENDKSIWVHYSDNILYVLDSDYSNVENFKDSMSGTMLYYELAEPEYIDISNLISNDNYIEVEGGGTITMINEYGYNIPSEVTFKIKTYLKHDKPIIVDSGDIFLATRNKILNIRYDPNITGYKYNIQEKMIPTLGAKYPKITCNGEQNYRSFTISGTIARGLEQENENADFNATLERTYDTLDAKTREFILEKRFRDNVLEFLQSSEVKLYKSLTEGNIFVYLTDISLTPKKELGRMIYSFSALATEVAEANSASYQKYFS